MTQIAKYGSMVVMIMISHGTAEHTYPNECAWKPTHFMWLSAYQILATCTLQISMADGSVEQPHT